MARILAFSGGLDSIMLKKSQGFENRECLFIRMGTQENKAEEEFIDNFYPGVRKHTLPLQAFELHNNIIPFRNAFITLVAAQYASNIYFGYTAGDTTRDKDYVFKAQMEGLLNYFVGVKEKAPFEVTNYTIHMPFKEVTKVHLIGKYLEAGHPIQELLNSHSCYNGNDCGICRSCLRRFVAFKLNNIHTSYQYNPVDKLPELLRESIAKNRHSEIDEIRRCIEICKVK